MNKLLPLLLCLVLQACALPRALPEASSPAAGGSDVVVIGKIELVPPIDPKFEQKSHWNVIGEKRMHRMWMATGAEYKPVNTSKLDAADFQESLEADWGVPFMVKAPRHPRTFLNGGVTHLNVLEQERLWFPGGYYFDVPQGASAVYIGTLRFHRNDFNTITRVEVVDEPKDIATVLKTGPAADVRTSLLKRAR